MRKSTEGVRFQYSEATPKGFRYRVVLWTDPTILDDQYWWVHNTYRNVFRRIGKAVMKGTNYYDEAVAFCQRKQRELEE